MTRLQKPFIQVPGIVTPQEARWLISRVRVASELCGREGAEDVTRFRELFLGILVSSHTLAGKKNPKNPNRYPDVTRLHEIVGADVFGRYIIHYSTDEPATLVSQVEQILERCPDGAIRGFQLNMTWPEPFLLMQVQDRFGLTWDRMRIILQVDRDALRTLGGNPQWIADRIATYSSVVTDVLFDPCGSSIEMGPILREIQMRAPHLKFGLSGGWGPTLDDIAHFLYLEQFPDLSLDAAYMLRMENSDDLHPEWAAGFVLGSFDMVKRLRAKMAILPRPPYRSSRGVDIGD